MTATKTNERPGTRAVLRHSRMSAYKAREVLNLIRGQDFERAMEILEFCDRGAAEVIGKLLSSAAANARHNDGLEPAEMFVAACYADEGTTLKRWRPRARGRATRIRKRTCHITVILARLPESEITRRRARVAAEQAERRARRVAGGRRRARAGAAAETTGMDTEETTASSEALAALSEARAIETTTHHAELEAEAGSALDLEEDEEGDEDYDEDDGEEFDAEDYDDGSDEDDADDDNEDDTTADADDTRETSAETSENETDVSASGHVVDEGPAVSPAPSSDDGADSESDEEN